MRAFRVIPPLSGRSDHLPSFAEGTQPLITTTIMKKKESYQRRPRGLVTSASTERLDASPNPVTSLRTVLAGRHKRGKSNVVVTYRQTSATTVTPDDASSLLAPPPAPRHAQSVGGALTRLVFSRGALLTKRLLLIMGLTTHDSCVSAPRNELAVKSRATERTICTSTSIAPQFISLP